MTTLTIVLMVLSLLCKMNKAQSLFMEKKLDKSQSKSVKLGEARLLFDNEERLSETQNVNFSYVTSGEDMYVGFL